jgi:hypothetical protein
MMTVQCQHNERSEILTWSHLNWLKWIMEISLQNIGLTSDAINVVAGRVAGALARLEVRAAECSALRLLIKSFTARAGTDPHDDTASDTRSKSEMSWKCADW